MRRRAGTRLRCPFAASARYNTFDRRVRSNVLNGEGDTIAEVGANRMTLRSREHWRWLLAVAAIGTFTLLLAEEFIQADEPFTLSALLPRRSSSVC